MQYEKSEYDIPEILQQLNSNSSKYKSLNFSEIKLTLDQLSQLEKSIKNNIHIGYIKFNDSQKDPNNLISNIYKKIKDNNKSFLKYSTPYIHALISRDIYQDIKKGQIRDFNDEKWKIITIVEDDESKYFGGIYQNQKTGSLILAHRGTIINIFNAFKPGMAATDIKGVFQGQIVRPQFYNWLITCEAIELAKEQHRQLSVTGHSLGAWHAELSIYFAHKDFNYHEIICINFDSPGSYTALENMRPNIINNTNIDLDNLDITTYTSYPNIVNSCNKHIGKVFQLKTSFEKIPLLKKFGTCSKDAEILADLTSHSIDCIIAEFDPSTGKPKAGQVAEMKDWPHITYKYDKSQGNKLLYSAIEKAAKYIGIEMAKSIVGSATEKIANSIIARSDTSLQSIFNLLDDYCQGRIDTDQLKEIYLNNIPKQDPSFVERENNRAKKETNYSYCNLI